MRAFGVIALVIAALAVGAFLLRTPAAPAPDGSANLVIYGTVTKVVDGDTLEVELDSGPEKVRLYGIDTPEARAPWGREATRALRDHVEGRTIELKPVADDPRDKYDRLIAVVYAGPVNVNEQMIADGHAWAYRRYLGQVEGDAAWCDLEAAAREARKGLWSLPAERWVPPWIYRRRQDAPPGSAVPSRDYLHETAVDCRAAIGGKAEPEPPLAPPAPTPRDEGHPPGCDIKGNINGKGAKIYHLPGTRDYDRTKINPEHGERWFCSEREAAEAGWRAARFQP